MSDVGWILVGVVVLLLAAAVVVLRRTGEFHDRSIATRGNCDVPVQEGVKAGGHVVTRDASSPVQWHVEVAGDPVAREIQPTQQFQVESGSGSGSKGRDVRYEILLDVPGATAEHFASVEIAADELLSLLGLAESRSSEA